MAESALAAAFLAHPAADYLAVALMAGATYLCRASGILFMSRMRITPRIDRALRALPGSIVVATILPIAAQSGLPAVLGLAAAIATMALVRIELAGVAAGLAAVSLARLAGL
ncbi:AzlD family protein [Salinarimonas chemoclinalis]|uniref:AzlD family protein n=1 Tax=Salinarimonas chemoclinalis TaxID=3241599 RepID=UPI003556955C